MSPYPTPPPVKGLLGVERLLHDRLQRISSGVESLLPVESLLQVEGLLQDRPEGLCTNKPGCTKIRRAAP